MLRFLQVVENKPLKYVTANEDMTRGAVITEDYATETVAKATGTTDVCFVDVDEKYEGWNAVVTPTSDAWEDIKASDLVIKIPLYPCERYATTEVDTTLDKGTYLKADGGKFVEAEDTDDAIAVFEGVYADPTFEAGKVGIVQIVPLRAGTTE